MVRVGTALLKLVKAETITLQVLGILRLDRIELAICRTKEDMTQHVLSAAPQVCGAQQ